MQAYHLLYLRYVDQTLTTAHPSITLAPGYGTNTTTTMPLQEEQLDRLRARDVFSAVVTHPNDPARLPALHSRGDVIPMHPDLDGKVRLTTARTKLISLVSVTCDRSPTDPPPHRRQSL